MLLCLLLGVVVLGCDGRAAAYAEAAARVPPAHWRMVRSVELTSLPGYADNAGRVALPLRIRPYALYHEVGHVVSLAEGGWRWRAYSARFWPGGRQVGTVPTPYARTNVWEDYAESYAAAIGGTLDHCCPGRAAWMRAHLEGVP